MLYSLEYLNFYFLLTHIVWPPSLEAGTNHVKQENSGQFQNLKKNEKNTHVKYMNVDKTFFLKCTTSRLSFRRFRWDTVRHILIRNIQRLIVSLERPGNSQLQLHYWQNTFDKFLFLVNTVHFSLQFGKLAILFRMWT